jgi:hypothetical protein
MHQILKKSARLLLILLLVSVVGGTGLFLAGYFYGDQVKQLFVIELNKRLDIEIKVQSVHFNVFENFPYATVQFRKVVSNDRDDPNNPPLIKAEEISLIFNFYDLIRKNYKVEKVLLKDAFLNLEIAEDGKRNFDIFRQPEKTKKSNLDLVLEKFIFRNVEIAYINYPADQDFLFFIRRGELKGKYSVENFEFLFLGNMYTTYLTSGEMTILKEKELDLELDLFYDHLSEKLVARMGSIKSNGMRFDIAGEISTKDKAQNLDLKIISGKSSLASYLDVIPSEFLEPLADYKITGNLDFEASIQGPVTGTNIPEVKIAFNFDQGKILHPASGFAMEKVNFSGKFDNGGRREEKFYSIALSEVKANIRGGDISGNLNIRDFTRPEVSVQLYSALDLRELKSIYPIEYLKSINGKLELQMNFSNKLQNFRQFTQEDFLSSKTSGTMTFRDMNFTISGNLLTYSDFNGTFRFSNKDLIIDAFSGKVSDNDFSMTGQFRNILAYAFRPDEKLFIQADLNSESIDLDRLFAYKEQPDESPYILNFSDRLSFDMNVHVGSFRFRKFSGQNITGKFSQNNGRFTIRDGSLNTMDGSIAISGSIDWKNESNYLLTCDAMLNKVDIRKLFSGFGNFGQDNLTENHLRGKVSAKVYYHSSLTPSLYVNPASVYSLADIAVTDGELVGYTPLYALSKYVKREELEHIRFSTLKNNIRIENRVIYFPQMVINSNTLNITLFGQHDFDNITDYHIQLLISELLVKKPREAEAIQGIFEKEGEGGKAKLFLSMTGPADNPIIRYDTREVRNKIASDLAVEKGKLTEVMKDEFSWIKGHRRDEEKGFEKNTYAASGSSDFIFEWDEVKKDTSSKITTPLNTKPIKTKEKKSEKDFIIRWDED